MVKEEHYKLTFLNAIEAIFFFKNSSLDSSQACYILSDSSCMNAAPQNNLHLYNPYRFLTCVVVLSRASKYMTLQSIFWFLVKSYTDYCWLISRSRCTLPLIKGSAKWTNGILYCSQILSRTNLIKKLFSFFVLKTFSFLKGILSNEIINTYTWFDHR